MPLTDEDIVRDLFRRYTADVFPDASVATEVAVKQRRREIRRRAGSAVAAGAALGVAATVIAIVPGKGSGPGVGGAGGAKPLTGTASGPAITLSAGQRVLYQLSAAAAKQQPAQARYVTLYEKEDGNLDTNVIDTQTGTDYGYQRGYNGAPSGVGTPAKNFSPTAAGFAAMPLDPAGLRTTLIAYYTAQAGAPAPKNPPAGLTPDPRPTPANDIVFSPAMDFLWNPSTPPQLRAALFKVLAEMPAVQVDASARDLLGRPAVKLTWTASDTTVYAVYENPANGTVLEQTYKVAGSDGPSSRLRPDAEGHPHEHNPPGPVHKLSKTPPTAPADERWWTFRHPPVCPNVHHRVRGAARAGCADLTSRFLERAFTTYPGTLLSV